MNTETLFNGKQAGPKDATDLLIAQADALEAADGAAAGPLGEPVAEEKPALTNEQCLCMGYGLMRETLCSFAKVKSPQQTLSDDVIAPMAKAQAAVLEKYGINLQAIGGDYMIEIQAAIVSVPVLLAFRAGLQLEIAESKKLAKPAQSEALAVAVQQ